MKRQGAVELEERAVEELASLLRDMGLEATSSTRPDGGFDVFASIDGYPVAIEVKATAYGTEGRIRELQAHLRKVKAKKSDRPLVPVLVADRITADARRALDKAGWGWLDRRGHVRIRAPGILIDRDFAPIAQHPSSAKPLAGLAGKAVAFALLTNPEAPLLVRRSAPLLGISPASISNAVGRLREYGLIDEEGRAVVPELFWSLANVWAPERVWLAKSPDPSYADVRAHDLQGSGWCLTGTSAAARWGAPVTTTAGPMDWFVPAPVALSIAVRRFGASPDPLSAAASIAVAPVRMVTQPRFLAGKEKWPLAHPLAVALDLALDLGRGREILDQWTPPPEFHRVW